MSLLRVSALFALFCLAAGSAAAQTTTALTVAWDASADTSVAGYRVVYGTSSRTYTGSVDAGQQTSVALSGLAPGQRYYIAVQAYTGNGVTSDPSEEVSDVAPLLPSNGSIVLGLGPHAGNGGWFAVNAGPANDFQTSKWGALPWGTYNAGGGGLRIAAGDVDGDVAKELVIGLGPAGGGWVAVLDDAGHNHALLKWLRVSWNEYIARNGGEVFPAVGDLDGDGRAEIVLGLGRHGQGWYQIFDDSVGNFRHLAWRQVTWPAYNAASGETHPAVGDIDGDGESEIVLGLGAGGGGWLQVVGGASRNYGHRTWIRIAWAAYSAANGTTYPAIGDLDGDGRGEIVAGLGRGGDGWFQIFDDAINTFALLKWHRVEWPEYNAHSGETHPAIGNVDADPELEIVLGFAEFAGNGGNFEVRDDSATGHTPVGMRNVGWAAFTTAGGSIYPAIIR